MDRSRFFRRNIACAVPRLGLLLLGLVALSFWPAGCGSNSNPSPTSSPTSGQADTAEKRYHLAGTVVAIDKDQNHLIVNHGDIPGFMSAMTMPYPVADPETLNRVAVGDQITADVVVANGEAKLENVVVVKKGNGKPATPTGASLQTSPDDVVPNFVLLNQSGKSVHLDQYRGKAVLLTFIYTRCPLPDYCPLMSHNFAEIEKDLTKTPAAYAKTHLLSISFDSKYDTPAVLRNYATAFVADPKKPPFGHWEFTSIPDSETADVSKFFNLFVSQEGGQITHSMSTAIISPDGHLYKMYPDNTWKPGDVLNDLTMAASMPTRPAQETSARPGAPEHS